MHGRASTSDAPDFLAGGGATGALLRAHDWTSSPLGDPAAWPQALKTLAAVMLIVWGPEHTTLYNDGYALSSSLHVS